MAILARTMSNGYVSVVAVVPARDPANILNGAGKYLEDTRAQYSSSSHHV